MPFRAYLDGELVVPAMVNDQRAVTCPECGGTMYPRDRVGAARHFFHADGIGDGGCSLRGEGESPTHARCVALAVATLKRQFRDQADYWGAEVPVELPADVPRNGHRRADALLEFDGENPYFGEGLIIEVQHGHEEKDLQTVTHDYLQAGYSVAWLSTKRFGEEALEYKWVENTFRSDAQQGYSVSEENPRRFIDCESYAYQGKHRWRPVPEYILTVDDGYEVCVGRGCDRRRRYDDRRDQYVYDVNEEVRVDLPLKALRGTLVWEYRRDHENVFQDRFGGAAVEKLLASRPEIERCRGPKGFHEWKAPETVWSNFDDRPKVELQGCQHCPVQLLTNLRGRPADRTDVFFGGRPPSDVNLVQLEEHPDRCQHASHAQGSGAPACPDCGVLDPTPMNAYSINQEEHSGQCHHQSHSRKVDAHSCPSCGVRDPNPKNAKQSNREEALEKCQHSSHSRKNDEGFCPECGILNPSPDNV